MDLLTLLIIVIVVVLLLGGGYSYYTTRNNVGHVLLVLAIIVVILILVGIIPSHGQTVDQPVVVVGKDYTALIVAIGTLVTTIVTGIIAVIAALRAGTASNQSIETAKGLVTVGKDVHKIELATNSMKDALVKSTGDQKLAEGTAIGIAQERANPQQSRTVSKDGVTDAPDEVIIVNPETDPVPVKPSGPVTSKK